jgi:hypothetical protein
MNTLPLCMIDPASLTHLCFASTLHAVRIPLTISTQTPPPTASPTRTRTPASSRTCAPRAASSRRPVAAAPPTASRSKPQQPQTQQRQHQSGVHGVEWRPAAAGALSCARWLWQRRCCPARCTTACDSLAWGRRCDSGAVAQRRCASVTQSAGRRRQQHVRPYTPQHGKFKRALILQTVSSAHVCALFDV